MADEPCEVLMVVVGGARAGIEDWLEGGDPPAARECRGSKVSQQQSQDNGGLACQSDIWLGGRSGTPIAGSS